MTTPAAIVASQNHAAPTIPLPGAARHRRRSSWREVSVHFDVWKVALESNKLHSLVVATSRKAAGHGLLAFSESLVRILNKP